MARPGNRLVWPGDLCSPDDSCARSLFDSRGKNRGVVRPAFPSDGAYCAAVKVVTRGFAAPANRASYSGGLVCASGISWRVVPLGSNCRDLPVLRFDNPDWACLRRSLRAGRLTRIAGRSPKHQSHSMEFDGAADCGSLLSNAWA